VRKPRDRGLTGTFSIAEPSSSAPLHSSLFPLSDLRVIGVGNAEMLSKSPSAVWDESPVIMTPEWPARCNPLEWLARLLFWRIDHSLNPVREQTLTLKIGFRGSSSISSGGLAVGHRQNPHPSFAKGLAVSRNRFPALMSISRRHRLANTTPTLFSWSVP